MSYVGNAVYAATAGIIPSLVAAVADGTAQAGYALVDLVQHLERAMEGEGSYYLRQANQQVAEAAQEATIAAYESARAAGRHSPPYRTTARNPANIRYAGGLLLSALTDPSFVVGNEEGIFFGNVDLMNARARQWARLNFGAGPVGGSGRAPRSYPVVFDDLAVASIGVEGSVRPGFSLPRGFWIGEEFYPRGEVPQGALRGRSTRPNPARNTRGIVAEGWLDAGVQAIAALLPQAYRNAFRTIIDDAIEEEPTQLRKVYFIRAGRSQFRYQDPSTGRFVRG